MMKCSVVPIPGSVDRVLARLALIVFSLFIPATLVAQEAKLRTFLKGHTNMVSSVAFTPDGKILASASWDHTVRLWDTATNKDLAILQGHTHHVDAVAFSPDGKTLASGGWDKTARLWDVATQKERAILKGHHFTVFSVAFSPDSKTLATGSDDETIRLWDVATGKETNVLKGQRTEIFGLAFSPDGKTLASGAYDNTIRFWDVETGKEQRVIKGSSSFYVNSLTYSRDGKTLAAGSWDQTVSLWDTATGKGGAVYYGHAGQVTCVRFSPDGKTLASASYDKTIKLWDVTTNKELSILHRHTKPVKSVAFSPDGKTLASGSHDHTIGLWDLPGATVCDRSKPVCVALEEQLKKKCADITAADLATVTELKLPHIHIRSFKENDFAGLTKLKKLHFYSLLHNQGRPKDPIAISEKVFAKLSTLEELVMEEDELGLLPDGVFSGLQLLRILDLTEATLPKLPKSMLTLPKIETVYFDGMGMSKEDYATLKNTLGNKLKKRR